MKKMLSLALALCLCLSFGIFAQAEESGAYVLMNIPYADFYAAEDVTIQALDAVSSASMVKTRLPEQVGGSYHVNTDGSDVTGIIFPVYVKDLSLLESLGGEKITDESSVVITVTAKGEEITTEYSGREALFEAPSYSWYVLPEGEVPTQYKTMTACCEPEFSAVNSTPEVLDAEASFFFDKHVDLAIKVSGAKDVLDAQNVSAVILTADDGTGYGMRHSQNLHKKYDIGFNLDSEEYAQLKGKTITEIQYITPDGNYVIPTSLAVVDDPVLALLNGTYIELFPEFANEKYYDFWMETIQSHGVDEATAKIYYSMLTDRFMGRLMGEEAVEVFSSDPESMVFDCYFENGLAKLTVNGNVISGMDSDGNELFCHTYAYAGEQPVIYFGMDQGITLHIYQTKEADAGIFTYFAFADDNLHDTQHIEYRYGDDLEALGNYTEGPYAYWLASGIADGYKDSLIQDCISLFVSENVGGEAEAEEMENTFGVFPAVAGEGGTTYVNLFDVILGDSYDVLWRDYIAAVVGEENAAVTVAHLKDSISSDLYGEQAVEAFADGGMAFDCFFINGAESFTFLDDTVTITKTDGTSEMHTYEYLGEFVIGEGETMNYMGQEFPIGMECDAYVSTDEAGEFQYILLCPDTMDTTFHIEFRYGKDLDELRGYMVGPYAYWLSAGIDREADEQTIQNVIALFCLENMDYSSHTDAALKQLTDLGFVGTWVADLSAYGDMFADVDLSFVLDVNGHGITTMNGETTSDFEAYAFDNGEAGDGAGIYIAYSNLDLEAEAAEYTLMTGEDGNQILTFYSDEGVISYVKAAA